MKVRELLRTMMADSTIVDFEIVFRVPGGGDYSSMDLEVVSATVDRKRREVLLEC